MVRKFKYSLVTLKAGRVWTLLDKRKAGCPLLISGDEPSILYPEGRKVTEAKLKDLK